tara:strand:- start:417 stop:773 length:357 start_codon:yes stop_codon:yes gene_type:complete
MGFFSWHTTDTDNPIWNVHTGKNKRVYMIDNKGNSWKEDAYEGYGKFGGKDYYELLAEMNGLNSCRSEGLKLDSDKSKNKIYPNFVSNLSQKWVNKEPKDHFGQGYFDDNITFEEFKK